MFSLILRGLIIISTMVAIPIGAGVIYSTTQDVSTNSQPTRVVTMDTMGVGEGLSFSNDVLESSTQNDSAKADDQDGIISDSAARIDTTAKTE